MEDPKLKLCVLAAVKLSPQMTKEEVPGTSYGLSASGWIDRKLFCG